MTSDTELMRLISVRSLPDGHVVIEANEKERSALAERFGIGAVHDLRAEVTLSQVTRGVHATGTLHSQIEQECATSGEPFPVTLEEPVDLLFVPATKRGNGSAEEEVELDTDELDEMEYTGDNFDLGEAVAQTLGLAIDPYARGPNADAVRQQTGIVPDDAPKGPLAEALTNLSSNRRSAS